MCPHTSPPGDEVEEPGDASDWRCSSAHGDGGASAGSPDGNEGAMAVRMLQAEPMLRAGAELAEGPRWDARTQRLLWVDVLAGSGA